MQAALAPKRSLYVVGTQHDDEQVDDLMALEEGVGGAQGVHRFVDGVYKDGRPAGEALLGDEIIAAQRGLQAAGPAFLLVEADPAVGTIRRVAQ